MIEKENVVKKYKYSIFLKLLIVFLEFLDSVLISRCLGVELRGKYTIILNFANLIQMFLVLGLGNSYPTLKREHFKDAKEIVSTIMYLFSFIYLLFLIPIILCATQMSKYIAIIAYLLILENQVLFIAIVDDIVRKNKLILGVTCIYTCILLIAYLFFKKNLDIIMFIIIMNHIIIILTLVFTFKIFTFKFKKYITANNLKKIFSIAIPVMLMNLLMYINYHADVIFLKIFSNNYHVIGLYGVAITFGNMLWIIPDAFKEVIYNRSCKNDNPQEIIASIVINFFICLLLLLAFLIFGKLFIKIIYGREYIDSYGLIIMMFIGTFPMIFYKLIHPLYIANGKVKIVSILLLIAAIVNIIGNILLIPKYSGYGAATASVISYLICGIIFFIRFCKDYKISMKDLKDSNLIKKILTIKSRKDRKYL